MSRRLGDAVNGRLIASHDATAVNPRWELVHVTGPDGIREFSITCGDGWLVLDPREPDDRAQMVEISNALLAAAASYELGIAPPAGLADSKAPAAFDLLEALRRSFEAKS